MFLDPSFMRTLNMVLIPLGILQLILMITAIVSLFRKPYTPGNDRLLWLLLILLINIIGPIIYFAIGSNKLDEKAAQYENERAARYENDQGARLQ